jgi:HD-GYP domain-containing protein (c-di-GMP phosphodiesterase class II)
MLAGRKEVDKMVEHHAAMAKLLGQQLELNDRVLGALGAAYEQWDGRGWPGDLKGEEVPLPVRIAQIAEFVEVAFRVGGLDGAKRMARDRAAKQFDPHLAEVIAADAEMLLADIDSTQTWDEVITAEPALTMKLGEGDLDSALGAVANFVDLKSPYFLGHARAVADLAQMAASQLGLPADEARTIWRAGVLSGLGRLGVSNAILDKPGSLGPGEWERVQMHPYLTQRMLRQSEALRPFGAVAGQLRERLDGSRLSRRSCRQRDLATSTDRGRCRRVPSDVRAASTSTGTE